MIPTTNLTEQGKGWTLWKWGVRVELWYFPQNIRAHTHPGQRVEVMPLWGHSRFNRIDPVTNRLQSVAIERNTWFRRFTIPAGWPHWFSGGPVVFLNFTRGQSPSVNYEFYGRSFRRT